MIFKNTFSNSGKTGYYIFRNNILLGCIIHEFKVWTEKYTFYEGGVNFTQNHIICISDIKFVMSKVVPLNIKIVDLTKILTLDQSSLQLGLIGLYSNKLSWDVNALRSIPHLHNF